MPIDALPDDLDALRALVSCLSSERDAAIEECRRGGADDGFTLLGQLQRAQFGRRSERLDHEQMQLALEDIERRSPRRMRKCCNRIEDRAETMDRRADNRLDRRFRRLARDFERYARTVEAFIRLP